ncbi:hypothetical protein GDO86_004959 [Hymenochirus boettgeri]|uniref:Uncharacterized protein n=1 Tax=Hymenochirus boettgeri TaxID=247094 RepID=A0A8T2J7H3_9PIPI|nr:hypothetical protein GDO86_004959 [Hymenochirus boettgeri]
MYLPTAEQYQGEPIKCFRHLTSRLKPIRQLCLQSGQGNTFKGNVNTSVVIMFISFIYPQFIVEQINVQIDFNRIQILCLLTRDCDSFCSLEH